MSERKDEMQRVKSDTFLIRNYVFFLTEQQLPWSLATS